jgi:hypothetical protein
MEEIISEVWEKLAAVDSAETNSKEMLPRMHQHFVDARREISVGARILSPPIFCRHQYFVAANIFCRREHFCRHQYFVGANVLLPPIFCRR